MAQKATYWNEIGEGRVFDVQKSYKDKDGTDLIDLSINETSESGQPVARTVVRRCKVVVGEKKPGHASFVEPDGETKTATAPTKGK